MTKFLFLPTLFLLSSCITPTEKNSVDNWIGDYIYEEDPVKAVADYSPAMVWKLKIDDLNGSTRGTLEVEGQQTYFEFQTDIKGNSDQIAIVYNRLLEETNEMFKKGDTLFVLTKTRGHIKTTWQKLEPRLDEAPPKECHCFDKTKNSSQ